MTREARQVDIDRLINERMMAGMKAFLARIERVAALPPGNELLARSPGSSRAYILAPGGQGIPVAVAQEDDGAAVELAEVLSPEAPLSTLDAEVVGQLRQWHADSVHRVPRATLMRWYLGRTTFAPIPGRAKFCFLSAIHERGYPMYWASQMDRAELEQTIRGVVEAQVYPDNRVVPYIVGAFFFSRRLELLDEFAPNLSTQLNHVISRLREETSVVNYLTRGRTSGASTIRVASVVYNLSDLMASRTTEGQALFDQLMAHHPDGNVPEAERPAAHQLDMLVHGDADS
jgi:hypothetical protein